MALAYKMWWVQPTSCSGRPTGVGSSATRSPCGARTAWETPLPPWHLQNVGVMGADLINFALERNGLPPGGGTVTFAHYLVRTAQFDPDTPGEPGAIAFRPYEGPGQAQQGSIALYVGEHQLIQAIPEAGVTDAYTDQETFSWGAQHRFTVYGFLPGVRY